jgi:ATP-binding cassette subfamily F protein uup
LEKKQEHLTAMESMQSSMSNKARRETAWLKAGVKARTTKSQSRINEAHELIEELSNLSNKTKSARSKVNLEIDSTERKTKKLIELKNISVGYPGLTLVENLTMNLGPKKCVGLLGHNGSGKTTFLKTLIKEINPLGGSVRHADDLKIVYFEQKRSELPSEDSLVSYLGDGSDYVVFKDQSVHVASYASRFLFSSDKLNMPIHKLSGGEQARLLLAKVFLKPSDVLILDEPTNDLDIETIDVLEDLIENFGGLVLLVSHDRSFLKSVCTDYLAFDGKGAATPFADLEQWLSQSLESEKKSKNNKKNEASSNPKQPLKPKLSYNDKKFLENAENIILEEEDALESLNSTLEKVVSNGQGEEIQKISVEISEQQKKIDALYAKWDDLNQKLELIKGV